MFAETEMTAPAASAPTVAAGSVGTVETRYLDLPDPVRLDCGGSCTRSAWPTRPTARSRPGATT